MLQDVRSPSHRPGRKHLDVTTWHKSPNLQDLVSALGTNVHMTIASERPPAEHSSGPEPALLDAVGRAANCVGLRTLRDTTPEIELLSGARVDTNNVCPDLCPGH